MVNLNQIYLLGNLTRDPELKYTNEGTAIAEIGIAVNKKWKDSAGEDNVTVDYFNITAWNALAENCANFLKKGDRVFVGGHVNLRTWENRDGKKCNIINITADVVAASLEFSGLKKSSKKSRKTESQANAMTKNEKDPDDFVIEEKTYEGY
ncbi:MAG: single-stranded DNA-binding protein [Actinobacteria bacterium]|nr:single-stranded DNA-binding protein [Actinomycetota bacterium]MBM3711971.1 single-stranded DNA-binding protein [Actinomycetota bacterium]